MACETSPTLVLADVQLADGSSGINAVNDILRGDATPIVFVTAYPERLLTGRRAEPAFLVPKPFKHDMLRAIVSQALFFEIRAASPAPRAAAQRLYRTWRTSRDDDGRADVRLPADDHLRAGF